MRRVLVGRATIAVSALVLAAMMLVGSDTAVAQEKKKISWTAKPENAKYTFRQLFDIPDMPGHRISMNETRRTWPDGGGPVVEGRKGIEEISWGTGDAVAGNGFDRGYAVTRYENGDQIFGQWQDSFQSVINPDGSRRVTFIGTYITTGGTGTFRGVKGLGRFSGTAEFDANNKPTRSEYSAEGEYWFEK